MSESAVTLSTATTDQTACRLRLLRLSLLLLLLLLLHLRLRLRLLLWLSLPLFFEKCNNFQRLAFVAWRLASPPSLYLPMTYRHMRHRKSLKRSPRWKANLSDGVHCKLFTLFAGKCEKFVQVARLAELLEGCRVQWSGVAQAGVGVGVGVEVATFPAWLP